MTQPGKPHEDAMGPKPLPQPGTDEFQQLLDALVDGELDEPRRKQLLLRMEEQPQSWRQCALAFLQAQAFGQEFTALRDEVAHPPEVPSPAVNSWRHRGGTLLALAASFVLAFLLGAALKSGLPGVGVDEMAAQPTPEEVDARQARVLPSDEPADAESASDDAPQREPTWGSVQFVMDGDDGRQRVQIPVIDGVDTDAWLDQEARRAGLPRDLVEELKSQGHQVQTHRDLIPLRLQDGRRVWVPVDHVELIPAENRRYQ